MACQLTLRPGLNHWIVIVSDEQATSASDAVALTVEALTRWFDAKYNPLSYLESDPGEYRIGDARPVTIGKPQRVREGQNTLDALDTVRPASGGVVQGVWQCDEVYQMSSSHPWIVVASFFWRGAEKVIDWPAYDTGMFADPWGPGVEQSAFVWSAWYDFEAQSEDDAGWIGAQVTDARETVEAAGEAIEEAAKAHYGKVLFGVVAVGLAAVAVYAYASRKAVPG